LYLYYLYSKRALAKALKLKTFPKVKSVYLNPNGGKRFKVLELRNWFAKTNSQFYFSYVDFKKINRYLIEQGTALTSCVSNEIDILLPYELPPKHFWRLFSSIRLSSVIRFYFFGTLDGKRVDTGNAFSNSFFSVLNFNYLFHEIEDLCEVMEVIGKYESVKRNLKQLIFDESLNDIWEKDVRRCLLENGLERVVIANRSSKMLLDKF
jgi:hypothetical protein